MNKQDLGRSLPRQTVPRRNPTGYLGGSLLIGIGLLTVMLVGWLAVKPTEHIHERVESEADVATLSTSMVIASNNTTTATIILTQTVGTIPGLCAQTQRINVQGDTSVYYCYTVKNTSGLTLTNHQLIDGQQQLVNIEPQPNLVPGQRISRVIVSTISATTINTATWIANNSTLTATVQATDTTIVNVVSPQIIITKTVGLKPDECAASSTLNATVGGSESISATYCLIIQNRGDITFTQHVLRDPLLDLTEAFSLTLTPQEQSEITQELLSSLGITASLSLTSSVNRITNTAYITSTTAEGLSATASANAILNIEPQATPTGSTSPSAFVTLNVGLNAERCATQNAISITVNGAQGQDIYYCLIIVNDGNVALTSHTITDTIAGATTVYPLAQILEPGELITITHQSALQRLNSGTIIEITDTTLTNLRNSFKRTNMTIQTDRTVNYSGETLDGTAVTQVATARVSTLAFPTQAPAPTSTPIPPNTPIPPTSTPTDTRAPTNTFTPRYTATPVPPTATRTPETPTLTPTPLSPLPTPTFTPTTAIITEVESPTPTIDPNPPTDTPILTDTPISLLPTPTPTEDETTIAIAAGQTAQAATATSIANSPLPTSTPIPPTPTWTSTATATETATGTLTVTPTPTDTATETPTSTSVPLPTLPEPTHTATAVPQLIVLVPTVAPTPIPISAPDYLLFFARMIDAAIFAAGWIWFLCGSVIFFAVAGLFAGLYYRYHESERYDLIETEQLSQEELSSLSSAPESQETPVDNQQTGLAITPDQSLNLEEEGDDDDWPASLP